MEKPPTHRYEIWTARQDGLRLPQSDSFAPMPARPPVPVAPVVPDQKKPAAKPLKSVVKLDDLDTSMLLYGYGFPIELALDGICKTPNGEATKFRTKKISPDSVDVVYVPPANGAPALPRTPIPVGTHVDLNVDRVGALRGTLTSQNREGFKVAVDSSYQQVLGAKLNHLAAQRKLVPTPPPPPVPVIPIETRIEPSYKDCWFLDQTGTLRKGMIVNLSQIDALLRASIIPPKGAQIVFRGPRRYVADVTNIFKIGFMVKFTTQIPPQEFNTSIRFSDV